PGLDREASTWLHYFDSVEEKVQHHLSDLVLQTRDIGQVRIRQKFKSDLFLTHMRTNQRMNIFDQIVQVHRPKILDTDGSISTAQSLDEGGHAFCLCQDHVQILPCLSREVRLFFEKEQSVLYCL